MFRRMILVALGLVLASSVALGQVTIPDSPAGKTLQAWLTAFNSGDKAQIEAYCKTYQSKLPPEMLMNFRSMTGGFELLQIVKAERLHIEFLVKERNSDTRAIGTFDVKDADPPVELEAGLRALPPGASVSDL